MLALLGSTQREKPLVRDIKFIPQLFIPLVVSFTGHVFATELDWQTLWNQAHVLTLFVYTDEKRSWWYWRSKRAMTAQFALEGLAWTFTTTATSLEWPRRMGAEGWWLVCQWQWLDHSDIYLRNFIIHPQIDLWQGPQSTWTNVWIIETCPLSLGKGPRIFQQMCLLFQQSSSYIEQQKEGTGGGQKVPSHWISWDKTKQIHYSMTMDMLGRRSRSKNKSILLITHY